MTGTAQEIFRSDDFLVRAVTGFSSSACVVTFDSYTDFRSLDRYGFGEGYLAQRGIDAVHVVARENEWYLHPEMQAMAARIAARVTSYNRVLTYGSSMGGYAAIRFGRLVGAETAIAISPQFSIDPALVPFEQRWIEAKFLDFTLERTVAAPFVESVILFYDPRHVDRRHADLYRAHTRVIDVAIPYSGHPTGSYLTQTGLLQEAVPAIIQDQFDPAAFVREARRRRRHSTDYFYTLAQLARQPTRRVALSTQAIALAPGNPTYAGHHAWWLALAGRGDEAAVIFDETLQRTPDHVTVLYRFSEFREHVGDLTGALAAIDRCLALQPGSQPFRSRREDLLRRVAKLTVSAKTSTNHARPRRLWRFQRP